MEVSGQLHAPATLPPGKHSRYTWNRRLGGPQSRIWARWWRETFIPHREWSPSRLSCSL